jgi:hypothetical protein
MNLKFQIPNLKSGFGVEAVSFVAACRQTAASLHKIELSGFLPKAATPSRNGYAS